MVYSTLDNFIIIIYIYIYIIIICDSVWEKDSPAQTLYRTATLGMGLGTWPYQICSAAIAVVNYR